MFAMLLGAGAGPVAAQLRGQNPDQIAPPPAATPLPSDAELEAAGARIGGIEIDTVQVFDLDNPADNNWLFRTADHLHKGTRVSAIAAQLLFRRGDLYSRRLLDETERNIRQNSSFLREPVIRPIRYHDGVVDIVVITHDVWTLQPGVNFSRSGGTNTTGVDISDSNVFGYGKYVEIGHGQNVDRSSTFLSWADPNVWGSHWNDAMLYSRNSDGTVWGVGAGLPFYSLEARRDGGGDVGDNHSVFTRYRLGQQYDAYDDDWRTADLYIGSALEGDRPVDRAAAARLARRSQSLRRVARADHPAARAAAPEPRPVLSVRAHAMDREQLHHDARPRPDRAHRGCAFRPRCQRRPWAGDAGLRLRPSLGTGRYRDQLRLALR